MPIIGQDWLPSVCWQLCIISLRHSARALSERRQVAICSCIAAIFSRIALEGAACEPEVAGAGSAAHALEHRRSAPMTSVAPLTGKNLLAFIGSTSGKLCSHRCYTLVAFG